MDRLPVRPQLVPLAPEQVDALVRAYLAAVALAEAGQVEAGQARLLAALEEARQAAGECRAELVKRHQEALESYNRRFGRGRNWTGRGRGPSIPAPSFRPAPALPHSFRPSARR